MKDRFYTNNTYDVSNAQDFKVRVADPLDADIYLSMEASGWSESSSVSFYAIQNLRLTRAQANQIIDALSNAIGEYEEAKALAEYDAQRDSIFEEESV